MAGVVAGASSSCGLVSVADVADVADVAAVAVEVSQGSGVAVGVVVRVAADVAVGAGVAACQALLMVIAKSNKKTTVKVAIVA